MACNCATNEQINALYRQFGHEIDVPKGATLKYRINAFFTKMLIRIILILSIPYLLFYILRVAIFGDGRISLAEFFKFRKKIVKEDV